MAVRFILVDISNNRVSYRIREDGAIFSDDTHAVLHKNLVDFFNEKDKGKILAAYGIDNESPFLSRGDTAQTIIFGLFITCLLIAIPLSQTKVLIGSNIQPGGIFIFPLTFIFLDTINEIFGRRKGRISVVTAALCLMTSALFVSFSLLLPGMEKSSHDKFIGVYQNLPYLLMTNAICVLIADSANNSIYNFLKGYFRGGFLWLRCAITTVVGQLIYSAIWISIFFYGKISFEEQLHFIISNYEFKVIYSFIVCTPMTVFLVWVAKKFIYSKPAKL
ncbi:TPA: queuosine precursor transporter [Serratia marcescens]